MKNLGIIRRVDELGRIVIPKEIRDVLNINFGSSVEIFIDEGKIILEKYNRCCLLCNSEKELKNYNGKNICSKCIKEIKRLL